MSEREDMGVKNKRIINVKCRRWVERERERKRGIATEKRVKGREKVMINMM